ncbi:MULTISPECIES: aminoglycoside phosphotransferase family protein [Exiguobacterium]|uniref:aminoglycoside phosphotransferase family protein n=1 Tax=Exiguobacterium TaxID=33986 RepID=UPI00068BE3BE|nr:MULTISPECIES: aminoglycoside phosphotransferase family protein [Exiguobacterium]MCT4780212.1 aminoglycoside phosphotransferase family protein [Exiguobacterium soli]
MSITENHATVFEKISRQLKLGSILAEPTALSGGLLHKMFRLQTTHGTYAIKLLNPNILSRPETRQNFITSERIVSALQNEVAAVPALSFHASALQQIGTDHYLVFPWTEGIMLKIHQIRPNHAYHIGEQLARIHQADLSLPVQQTADSNYSPVEWDVFQDQIRQQKLEMLEPFIAALDQIKQWDQRVTTAMTQLAGSTVLSHRDLDAKNVLWNSDVPTIIDWESAGPIHPMHDFIETALYWSLDENNQLHYPHFEAFTKGYFSTGAKLHFPIEPALSAGYAGKLGWLAYSLAKALRLEPVNEQEQQTAVQQVFETLTALKNYEALCPVIRKWWQ